MGPLNFACWGTNLSLHWAQLILLSQCLSLLVANMSYHPLVLCPTLLNVKKAIWPLRIKNTNSKIKHTDALFGSNRGSVCWRIKSYFVRVSLYLEDTETLFSNTEALFGPTDIVYCIRIETRGGIYGQIYPFAFRSSRGQSQRDLLKAKGYIWQYSPSWVPIRTGYHFNSLKANNSLISLIDN